MRRLSFSSLSFRAAAKATILALSATAAIACSDSTSPSGPAGILRFINLAPLQDTVDLRIGNRFAVNNLLYGSGVAFLTGAADTAQVFTASPATTTTSLATQSFVVANAQIYTLVLAQSASGNSNVELLYFPDTVSAPSAGNAKVRFVNLSPSTASLDMYVIGTSADIATATPLVSGTDILYKTSSVYSEIASGTYRVAFTTHGTKTVVANFASFSLPAGNATTFVTFDSLHGGAPVSASFWAER